MDYCEIRKEDTEILICLKKAVLKKIKAMNIPTNNIVLCGARGNSKSITNTISNYEQK